MKPIMTLIRSLRRAIHSLLGMSRPGVAVCLGLAVLALAATLMAVFLLVPREIAVPEEVYPKAASWPLPRGYRIVRVALPPDATPGKAEGRKSDKNASCAFAIELETIIERSKLPSPDRARIVSRDYLVPTGSGCMKLLSALAPDETALPLDGRHLGDPDYPAISFRCARLVARSGKAVPERLEHWFTRAFPIPPEEEPVFISAVGDLMPGRGVESLLAREDGLELVFGDTLPILRSSDLMIGNLEGAVTSGSAKATKSYTFKYSPMILASLKDAGFDYLMTTNNHSFDYGAEGFADTLKALRGAGFATSGAGANLAEARRFWRTTIRGQPISVLSMGAYPVERTGFDGSKTAAAGAAKAGILWESPEIPELVREEKETGAFVIVCVHGGEEYRTVPSERQRAFYRKLADSGCDVVFGSHPHVLQPIERRGRSLIVYSLGNFLFPGMEGMPGAEESEIVRLGVTKGRIVYREVYPARLSGTRVALGDSVIY